MATVKIVTTADAATRLDELLWVVLWQPLSLPRDIRHTFSLQGKEFELLAQENGQAVGGLVAVWTGGTEIELRHLAVVSHAQGRGIGRNLVTELYRIAKIKNCRRIHTIARNTSGEFFRRLGFQTAPGQVPEYPIFIEHGITFELMERFMEQDTPANCTTVARAAGD